MTAVTELEGLISGLHEKAKELVRLAHRVGWTVRSAPTGASVNLIPPGPGDVLSIPPVRQWNESKLRSLGKKVLHYGDPDLVENYLKANEPKPAAPKPAPPKLRYEKIETPTGPKPTPPAPMAPRVELRPWLAKAAEGVLYPSPGVLERHENGRVTYVCALAGCDYAADNPKSVTPHFNRSLDHDPDMPRKIEYKRVAVLTEASAVAGTDALKVLDALRVAIIAERDQSDAERLKTVVADLAQERDTLSALLEVAEQERDSAERDRDTAEHQRDEWKTKWDQAKALFGGAA